MNTRLTLLLLAAGYTVAARAAVADRAAVATVPALAASTDPLLTAATLASPVEALDIAFLPVGAMLTWACGSADVEGFHVERSTDGRAFEVIGRVEAGRETGDAYNYLDTERPESRVYYRITSLHAEGVTAHSALAEAPATRRPRWHLSGGYSVEPTTAFAFEVEAAAVEMLACELQDFLGNPVLRHELLVQPGPNRLSVPTADLPAGAYQLKVTGGDVAQVIHFAKEAPARAAFEPLVRGN